MNKAELINFVVEDAGITKKDARIVIDSVIDGITKGVLDNGKVSLAGFGTFSVAVRKARLARNPRTGEKVQVGDRKVPRFKASRTLKDAVAATI